jgi:hypothetical protein
MSRLTKGLDEGQCMMDVIVRCGTDYFIECYISSYSIDSLTWIRN